MSKKVRESQRNKDMMRRSQGKSEKVKSQRLLERVREIQRKSKNVKES